MKLMILLLLASAVCSAQEFAIVNTHSTEYKIEGPESASISESYSIKILSDKGKMYGYFQDYTDRFRKITDIEVTIYDDRGEKVKKLKKGDGLEVGFNPSYEISDAKVFFIDPRYEQYPYTIEVKSKVKLTGFIGLPTWVPRPFFNLSVKQADLTVSYPENYEINFREQGVKTQNEKANGRQLATFKVSDLAAVSKKVRFDEFYKAQPKVYVTPAKFNLDGVVGSNRSWSEFGNWFLSLNSEPFVLKEKTKFLIDSLKASGSDTRTIIAKLYQFMQNNTRYVSIQLGIGGFKSLPTEDVEKHGYGDCKALTTYMKNMLASAGINSNYVLVRAGKSVPDAIADLPSNQFNHVFLGVPLEKDTILLECTSQLSPVNYTGSFTDDRNVLWIKPKESKIIRSRVYPFQDNVQSMQTIVSIDSAGHADISIESEQRGIFFDELMIYQMAPSDYVKDYNVKKFIFDDFSIKDFRFTHPQQNDAAFVSTFKIRANNLIKRVGDRTVMPIVNVNPIEKHIEKDNVMKFYSIKRGFTLNDETLIKIPEQSWVYNKPEPIKLQTPFGSYESSIEMLDGKMVIKRRVVIYKGEYTGESYAAFNDFFLKIERLENRKLVLNSKT